MQTALFSLRNSIDQIDKAFLKLIGERRQLVLKLAAVKQVMHLPAQDLERERKLTERWQTTAAEQGIPWVLAQQILLLLLQDAYTIQRASANPDHDQLTTFP